MSTPPKGKPGISLRLKLGALVAVVATIPLALIGWLAIQVNSDTLETTQRELQVVVLGDLSRTIDDEFADAEAGLDTIGRVLSDTAIDPDARIALAKATVEARISLDHAAIYTREGELIDVISERDVVDTALLPEQLSAELMAAAAPVRAVTGEVYKAEPAPRVTIAVAIRPEGPDGPISGFVVSLVSAVGIQDRVMHLAQAHLGAGPEALFVVDRDLRVIAHVDRERAVTRSSAKDAGALAGIDPQALQPMLARSGEFEGAQMAMVGTVIGLPDRPWAAVAQVPRARAYATLEEMRKIVIGTVAAVMLLAGGFGVLAAQRLTAPLRALTEFAGDLAKRRFDRRVQPRSRDELGVLASAMSSAAAELQASEAKLAREIEIRHDLGRYMPAEIVERVVNREQDMGLGGERRDISVMFMDVVAFTPLTEKLQAEAIVELLNHLFTMSTEIVFRHQGTVDKFIGDSMMAFWGAPADCEDHAERAVAAAEEILSWLEVSNQHFRDRYNCTVRLAIGINSGPCVVGNIGSDRRMEYTAIGEVVNVAARLEAIARPQQILVTERTRELAASAFDFASVGRQQIGGGDQPVKLYEVRL
ncbi:Adenylate cyclase [Enhygromyxa salina]|uniref:Adenylate cyclase n=1 Tax=Enhygromyxa salina TaxID=215803 RepID=A0A0C2DD24_9BACT|nr:adenylate/guanylate cyclase domain-containing protein [Enhygromyxa salina]KIG17602.1 Adenylate cyclase [Enhygromyxa salina]